MLVDSEAGTYAPDYPLVNFGPVVDSDETLAALTKRLCNNTWYTLSPPDIQELMICRVKLLQQCSQQLIDHVQKKESALEVIHISVGGSYPWQKSGANTNDVDFNVVVEGSYFDYYDNFEVGFLDNYITNPVKKVSFMIFGKDNLCHGKPVNDSIETKDYLHTDMTIREGVVMPYRNVTVYGPDLLPGSNNSQSLLTRIDRQLYQAELLLTGKVGEKYTDREKLAKASCRIQEAGIILIDRFFGAGDELTEFYDRNRTASEFDQEQVNRLGSEVRSLRCRMGA